MPYSSLSLRQMNAISQPQEYAKILIFLCTGFGIVYLMFLVTRFIAPKNPTAEKLTSYECGEEPTGSAWFQINTRFYVIALIFLLFDVEMAFIFPWSVIFGNKALIAADPRWGWLAFAEMLVFVAILLLGLVYLWIKGDLEWIKPQAIKPSVKTTVPLSAYNAINNEIYKVKQFTADPVPLPAEPAAQKEGTAPKPAFKPVFRRPAP
jgi:NADH-quinone oxidoreductase subunit A